MSEPSPGQLWRHREHGWSGTVKWLTADSIVVLNGMVPGWDGRLVSRTLSVPLSEFMERFELVEREGQ